MVSGLDGSCHWLEIFFLKIIVVYGWQHGRLLVTGLIIFSKQLFLQDHRFNQFKLFFLAKSFFCIHVNVVTDVVSRMDGSVHRFKLFGRKFC